MSDQRVNTNALDAPSEQGQAQRASEQESSQDSGSRASKPGNSTTEQANVAKLQSIFHKQLKEKEDQLQRMQWQITQANQRIAQMEDASAGDDYEKAQLQLKRIAAERDQYLAHIRQTEAQRQAEAEREQALDDLVEDFGLSPSDKGALREAQSYREALKMARKLEQERGRANEQRKSDEDDERETQKGRRPAPRPDLGGSRGGGADSRFETELHRIRKEGTARDLWRMRLEQKKGGR